MSSIHTELEKILPKDRKVPVFIHSDLLKASLFVKPTINRETTLVKHLQFLGNLFEDRKLWFPCFNYQFPKTRIYDVKNSICELGPLPEYYRCNVATWRTIDPIFSACGVDENPCDEIPHKEMNAFDEASIFAKLVKQNGIVFFYGASFSSATIIHHIEYIIKPLYRYNKVFSGMIIAGNVKHSIKYNYHVRPFGFHLDYAWDRLLTDLQKEGIAKSINNKLSTSIPATTLKKYWLERLNKDPFYLLDETSKEWVIPKVEKLGRRFKISDFEQTNS